MAVEKPVKVPVKNITSTDVISLNGGIDQRGEANADPNTFVSARNAMVNPAGLLTHRLTMKKWLPDTVGNVHEIFPATYEGELYYIVADDGRLKYCVSGDLEWTDIGTADTAATLTTALTGTNNDLVFTAVQEGYNNNSSRGANGDDVTIAYVDPGANDAVLSVDVSGTDITVNLATGPAGAITTTAQNVIDAIAADTEAHQLVVAENAASNDGTGVVTALAATNLAGGATGSNWVTTGTGIVNTFLRVQDKVLVLNGQDKLRYLDLDTFEVVQFTAVTDPTNAPTLDSATGITGTGNFKVYYAINFNSSVGQTAIGPILSQAVSKTRADWDADGADYLTINRNNTAPAGAVSWNMWISTAPAGASIQTSDMLLLAGGIDLSVDKFIDNGSLPIELSRGTAPEDNSTDGMIATYGEEDKGRPILYGDPRTGKKHNLYIGGDGENALDFSPTNGGYTVELNKGTNYYPQGVIGFRNGQGIPSMTVLFSNTQGLSKQTIIEQQTITYGNTSFVVWSQTEQNYGAAGVSSPYSVVNYLGSLIFPTTDGIVSMDTQASMQNVLSTMRISDKYAETVGSIKNSALGKIVGTAWSNRIYMSVPSRGYDYNNEILVYDMTRAEEPIWYGFDLRAQWIGTVSPREESAFVYVCQDNHIFRLEKGYVALDDNSDGTTSAFPVSAKGALIGTNQAHNAYVSVIQVVFYLVDVIGSIQLGVTYRNESGRMKTKTKTVTEGEYAKSSGGGWSSPGYLFQAGRSTYNQWDEVPAISDAEVATKTTIRVRVPLNVITNEMQWFINTNLDNSSFILRSVSYEGVNIGVRGDLR